VLAVFDALSKKAPKTISAVLATGLCLLLVPTIMASENWDDHDRSNRYTARDVASNYLNSCDKNAIIFTFGDNDTFPLWYAQEVEGVRTDVRVVNLSLFSTEWYVDQMKRAAYESAPIPSTLTWDKYKQGTRDYIPVYDRGLGHVEVKDVIDFIGNDSEQTKIPTSRGKSNYCPTDKLKLTVDKEAIIRNGLVPEGMEDQIVDEIKWKISGQGLTKAQMMILDILANFNWERPIYFAITVGADNFQGLEDYFQLEGLAYHLTPFKNASADGQVGKVATDKMFDNLINKFKWGNMGDPSVYLDETNMRMTMNFRNNFARLADALIAEGDTTRARIVLDRCVEVMPNEAISYNYFNIPIADAYYRLGEREKASEIVRVLADNYFDEMDYYTSIDQKTLSQMDRDYQLTNQVIGSIFNLAQAHNDKDALERISTLYQQYQ
ncbi:MAG: tetratricopeptide repeat protein, partial [Bacteroidetes bacterium]|nr:tetratricopeptide repeat protein [Bacteroidota bacterium]